jgi:hypothetical protein
MGKKSHDIVDCFAKALSILGFFFQKVLHCVGFDGVISPFDTLLNEINVEMSIVHTASVYAIRRFRAGGDF